VPLPCRPWVEFHPAARSWLADRRSSYVASGGRSAVPRTPEDNIEEEDEIEVRDEIEERDEGG
jgi:hypothetical protein